MTPMWVFAGVVLVAAVAVIASRLELGERLASWWRKELEKDESREVVANLRGFLWGRVLDVLVLGAVVKAVWTGRKAPPGTFEKTLWELFIAACIAIGIWIAFRMLDNRLNRSQAPLPDYREIKVGNETE